MRDTARAVKAAGAAALRAGAYKPRTSPYGFQGHGPEGLEDPARGRRRARPADRHRSDGHGRRRPRRRTCRRAPDRRPQHAEFRAAQGGRRGRQAGAAEARHVGQDRGTAARRRISARRGQRPGRSCASAASAPSRPRPATRSTSTPSPTSSRRPICRSSSIPRTAPASATSSSRWRWPRAACGADGLLVEVHENPAVALSDGAQSLYPDSSRDLMAALAPVVRGGREAAGMSARRPEPARRWRCTAPLPAEPDPLALYAALSDGGRRRDTMLLERSAGPSLLLDQAAVRIECRGQEVTLTALSAGGRNVLAAVAAALAERVVEQGDGRAHASASRAPAGDDAEERLLAPSPFDVLRALHRPRIGIAGGAVRARLPRRRRLRPCRPVRGPAGAGRGSARLSRFRLLARRDPWSCSSPARAPRAGLHRLRLGRRGEAAARLFRRRRSGSPSSSPRCEQATPLRRRPRRRRASPDFAEADLDDDAYGAVVARMKEHIAAGDVYQIVPVAHLPRALPRSARRLRRAPRGSTPAPIISSSPAPDHSCSAPRPRPRCGCSREDGAPMVEVKPIAGTRPRGADRRRGRPAGGRDAARSQGAGRAYDAGRSRPQRRRPGQRARHPAGRRG